MAKAKYEKCEVYIDSDQREPHLRFYRGGGRRGCVASCVLLIDAISLFDFSHFEYVFIGKNGKKRTTRSNSPRLVIDKNTVAAYPTYVVFIK